MPRWIFHISPTEMAEGARERYGYICFIRDNRDDSRTRAYYKEEFGFGYTPEEALQAGRALTEKFAMAEAL